MVCHSRTDSRYCYCIFQLLWVANVVNSIILSKHDEYKPGPFIGLLWKLYFYFNGVFSLVFECLDLRAWNCIWTCMYRLSILLKRYVKYLLWYFAMFNTTLLCTLLSTLRLSSMARVARWSYWSCYLHAIAIQLKLSLTVLRLWYTSCMSILHIWLYLAQYDVDRL